MHLPWGMIFCSFSTLFSTFPSQLNTNSTFYQNKSHALRPCATNCHKILRTWCKNPILCKTPNTLLQIHRTPTRARQSASIPTVVATQSPTTKRTSSFAHFQHKNAPPYAPKQRFAYIFCFFPRKSNQRPQHSICNATQTNGKLPNVFSQKTPTQFLRNSTLQ